MALVKERFWGGLRFCENFEKGLCETTCCQPRLSLGRGRSQMVHGVCVEASRKCDLKNIWSVSFLKGYLVKHRYVFLVS